MKTNLLKIVHTSVIILIISLSSLFTKAQNSINFDFNFSAIPIKESGNNLAIGSTYRFINIATNTNALVTIVRATGGATVDMIDDNTLTKPEAFSPKINIPANSNGMVEFKFEFFVGISNITKLVDTLSVTAIDIDGFATLKEEDALNLGGGSKLSFLSNNLEINVTKSGNEYMGVNVNGKEYTSVDTAAKQVMFTVSNNKIASFIYRAGGINTGTSAVVRQKAIYFKGFMYPQIRVLPVKYVSFSATNTSKEVMINWITENEINNSHFEIERSYNGINFKSIAIVLDGMDNGSQKKYAYKDNAANLQNNKVVYYRLKQVDVDGNYLYSNIVTVQTNNLSIATIQTFPNPFTNALTIKLNSKENGNAEVKLTNVNGQTIINKKVNVISGFNNINIDGLTNLPAGIYVATVAINDVLVAKQKIIK